jgi:hypothetical protein
MQFLVLASFLLVSINSYAQISENVPPKTFEKHTELATARTASRFYEIPFLDNDVESKRARKVKQETCNSCRKEFYGKPLDFNLNIKKDGAHIEQQEGHLWIVTLKSRSAKALQVYFSEFTVPEGATLHIYNTTKDFVMGAFTKKNMNASKKFATAIFPGNEATIEYFEPRDAKFKGHVIIDKIVHVFEDIGTLSATVRDGTGSVGYGTSGSCTVNVACSSGSPIVNQSKAVALFSYYDDQAGYNSFCSGFLVNSTDVPTEKPPYFLSAGHCVPFSHSGTDSYFFDHIFYFNYESATCENQPTDPFIWNSTSFQGAYLKSMGDDRIHNNDSDYALYELANKPQFYLSNVFYLGWDRRKNDQLNSNLYNISHPYADSRKIAIGVNPVPTGTMTYSSCLNSTLQVWNVSWILGVTQPMSSGSPLLNSDKRVIGLLSAGLSRCSDSPPPRPQDCPQTAALTGPDFFNRMDWIWNHPGQSSALTPWAYSPLYSYLDKTANGATLYIDGYSYPAPPPPSSQTCAARPDDGDPYSIELSLEDDIFQKSFGRSVSAYGDDIIVGAYGENKVYIYKRENCAIKLKQQLIGERYEGRFGYAVDIHGDYLIISDPGNGTLEGFVYIYKKNGGSWTRIHKFSSGYKYFGDAVSIYNDNALVGSPYEPNENQGTAYFYKKNSDGIWSQVTTHSGQVGTGLSGFGSTVDIKNNLAAIGGVGGRYSVYLYSYVYAFPGFTWTLTETISNPNTSLFGEALAISNNEQEVVVSGSGQILSFRQNGINWVNAGGIGNLVFGTPSFTPSDNYLVIAHGDARNPSYYADGRDKVSFLKKNAMGAWEIVRTVQHDVEIVDFFGRSVATSEDYTIIGSPQNKPSCNYSGAAYVYDLYSYVLTPDLSVCNQNFTGANTIGTGSQIVLGGSGCSVTYQPGSTASYEASRQITLKEGFWAKPGSNVSVVTKGCPDFYNGTRTGGGSGNNEMAGINLTEENYLDNSLSIENLIYESVSMDLNLSAFPIPVTGDFFTVESRLGEITHIQLYDVEGNLVKNVRFNKKTEGRFEVVAPNSRGVYFVRAVVNNKLYYKKIYFN